MGREMASFQVTGECEDGGFPGEGVGGGIKRQTQTFQSENSR